MVWMFHHWGLPVRVISPLLDCSSPETVPIQTECGRPFSAVLTRSGDVYAWWQDNGTFSDLYWEGIELGAGLVPDHEGVVPCRTWELKTDPIKLPVLPDLPDLVAIGIPGEEHEEETRLIKIAACDKCLIGLTNKGHVLKLDGLTEEDDARIWHYVSENMSVLTFSLKPRCAATKLLRDKQNQSTPSLSSNYRRRRSEKSATSGIVVRHLAHHPCKRCHLNQLRIPGLKIS